MVLPLIFILLLIALYKSCFSPPNENLAEKVVIITGGGSGIGESLVKKCAERKAKAIVLVGRRKERLLKVAEEVEKQFPEMKTLCIQADCAIQQDCKKVIEETLKTYKKIDCLIINHAFGRIQKLLDIPENELETAFKDTYEANVFGTISLVYYCLPYLEKNPNGGQILHISSLSALHAVPKCSLYSSSKIAIHRFYDCLRMELQKNSKVHFTIASPGLVGTETAATYVPEKDMKSAMHPDKCADECLDGMVKKEREVYLNLVDSPPIPGILVFYLATFFPTLMEKLQYWTYDFEKGEGIKDAILKKPE